MEMKTCPHCGARMPEEAAFCPHCARSVNSRKEVHPPRRLSGRAVRVSLVFLASLVLILAAWLYTRPRTYDDGGSAAGGSSHTTVPPLRSAFRSAPRSRSHWRSPSAASGVRRSLVIWLAGCCYSWKKLIL